MKNGSPSWSMRTLPTPELESDIATSRCGASGAVARINTLQNDSPKLALCRQVNPSAQAAAPVERIRSIDLLKALRTMFNGLLIVEGVGFDQQCHPIVEVLPQLDPTRTDQQFLDLRQL